MGERFLKSALAAPDFALMDSSLALPAPSSSTRTESGDRSLRVQRQVRLTLERKTKRSLSNGAVGLQKNGRSFDAEQGFSSSTKVNGSVYMSRTLSITHMKRPSRKVEMSPGLDPDLSRSRCNCSFYSNGMSTLPGPAHSRGAGTPMESSHDWDSFRRHAFSETPRGSRPHLSASTFTSTPACLSQPVGFQQHAKNGFLRSHGRNSGRREKHGGDRVFGSTRTDGGRSWQAQVKMDGQRSTRLKSFPPSGDGAEVSAGRLVASRPSIQQKPSPAAQEGRSKPPEMTLERAVNLLTGTDEETLMNAANWIQNQCLQGDKAKRTVLNLRGIEKLLRLLDNDSEELQRVAAAALRNAVYNSSDSKMEVKDRDGLAIILNTLTNSIDVETRRQLTGLMWNLSSHDILKECFPQNTARILTKSILVPSSGIFEGENPKDELLADADSFYNATGCLRNLSSAGPDVRKALRVCENLIDSLVYYIRGTVANRNTDDKSTENCVCILHNLTFQIESELLQHPAQPPRGSQQNLPSEQTSVGCFSYRSAKITQDVEQQPPLLKENHNPHGTEWLWSLITMRMYLSLVACSTRRITQEAAIGALQNITAEHGAVSKAIAVTLFQKEDGLSHIKKVLIEADSSLQRTAISLTANLSHHVELRPVIASQMLPEIVDLLIGPELTNEVTINLCHILNNLSQSDVKTARAIIDQGALTKIISISNKDGQASKTACALLQTMWVYGETHGALKKCGFKKSDFINAKTTRGANSLK
ncbi:plakophilin-2 [Kryptolebias marmoratus]|uniref:Plakophilin-2-like n=1 Tax=Kryptolebias marmoratus TaxID=37003 RepID=A0A3Q3B351_KRYMA|nr:plakophilin-2 [Kryptolebias marmoratus]